MRGRAGLAAPAVVAALGAALGAAGCSALPSFEAGTCGNYVLDPGEDCDDDTDGCQQCGLTCQPALAGLPCEVPGYTCGLDGWCAAPSGVFGAPGPEAPFAGQALAITDVDGDGIDDIVGVGDSAISLLYGSPSADLIGPASTLTPFAQGAPVFTFLDTADDSLDILVPTADGIAGYASPPPLGWLSPHPFSFSLGAVASCPNPALGTPFEAIGIDDENLGALVEMPSGKLGLAVIPIDQNSACPAQVIQLCDELVGDPIANDPDIDLYRTRAPAAPGLIIAVRLAPARLCVVALHRDTPAQPYAATTITPAGAASRNRPVLADVAHETSSGCPALVLTTPAGLVRYADVAAPAGRCALAPTSAPIGPLGPATPADAIAIDPLPLEPRLPGYARDALVLDTGVYAIAPGGGPPRELYRSDRRLSQVRAGDLDRDGDVDGVAVDASYRGGEDDLDVLRRTATGAFVLARVDTTAQLGGIEVGDFDGDDIDDIAYTERPEVGTERLLVAYGSSGGPLPAKEVGSYRRVAGLVLAQVEDSLDPTGVIQDLVVLDNLLLDPTPSPDGLAVSKLHGSPQRTLQSFVTPRPPPSVAAPRGVFTGVVPGAFFASVGGVTPGIDLLLDAVGLETVDSYVRAWPLRGAVTGQLDYGAWTGGAADGGEIAQLRDCARAVATAAPLPDGAFCHDTARYLAWRRGDQPDVVIGIDGGRRGGAGWIRRFAVIAPTSYAPASVRVTIAPAPLVERAGAAAAAAERALPVRALHALDLAGDGDPELIITFAGVAGTSLDGAVLVCDVDDAGVPGGCEELAAAVPALAGWRCVDAVPAMLRVGDRVTPLPALEGGADLLALCDGTSEGIDVTAAFAVSHDGAALRARVLQATPQPSVAPYTGIGFGDLTGDGLGDLAIVQLRQPTPSVLVLPQCAASDLACQEPPVGVGVVVDGFGPGGGAP